MSRTFQFTSSTLAIAGALLGASLATPAAGHAQAITAERTLLNLTATPPFATERPYSAGTAPLDGGIASSTEGTQALLGRTPTLARQTVDPYPAVVEWAVDAPIDGAGALLGQWTQTRTRLPNYQVIEKDGRSRPVTQTER